MTQAPSFSDNNDNPGQPTPGQFGGEPSNPDQGGEGGTGELSPEQIQEILKRDQHAQQHIQTLENEAKERKQRLEELEQRYQQMEKDLEQRESFESALEKLQRQQQPGGGGEDQTPKFDPDAVAETVLQRIQRQEQEKQAEQNKAKAIEATKERYGEQYLDSVKTRAEALSMTLEDVDDLAAKRPQVFQELFIGKAGKEAPTKPSVSGQSRVDVPSGTGSEEQRELYRTNRKAFFGEDNFKRIAESLRNKE